MAEQEQVRIMINRLNKICSILLAGIFFSLPVTAEESNNEMFSEQNTVGDILRAPEFKGFAKKLLPWDDEGRNNPEVKISEIGRLMPYHNNIVPTDILVSLNYLLAETRHGKQVFYEIYPKQDKRQKNTGIFFFRGKPEAPFAIICPGGGFSYVGSLHEGFPLALELSKKGYNAFVIKYRSGSPDWAMQDLAVAVSYIFAQAKELQISTDNYSVWGGSAGARMAAYIGSYGVNAFGGDNLPRPAAVIMAYTGHGDFTSQQPPTFMVVGENDWIANPLAMKHRAESLTNAGIKTEFHQYPNLGHGFGLGTKTSAAGWLDKAVKFWEKQIKRLQKSI